MIIVTDIILDINECEEIIDTGKTGEETCNLINARCQNTPGSYDCICLRGYEREGGVCVGEFCISLLWALFLSECTSKKNSSKEVFIYQIINKTNPLFWYIFYLLDINECRNDTNLYGGNYNICGPHGDCTNTVGSCFCSCDPGYELFGDSSCGRCYGMENSNSLRLWKLFILIMLTIYRQSIRGFKCTYLLLTSGTLCFNYVISLSSKDKILFTQIRMNV